MSIRNKVLTAVGYATAPKATFFFRHPKMAAGAWLAYRAARRTAPRRRRLAAVAVAAAAVPLAWRAFSPGNARRR